MSVDTLNRGDDEYGDWIECWQCFGNGAVAGCFVDTCTCGGDPDDADCCCAPRRCDICRGKGGWFPKEHAP